MFFLERNLNPKAACLKRRGDEEKMGDDVAEKRMNMSGSFDAPKRQQNKKTNHQVRRPGLLSFLPCLFLLNL